MNPKRTKLWLPSICGLLLMLVVFDLGFPKTPLSYKSPETVAFVVDATSGEPVKGAAVKIEWRALRPINMFSHETVTLHSVTIITDAQGQFSTSSWGPVTLKRYCVYTDSDPVVQIAKPGYKTTFFDNENGQRKITESALPFTTIKLRPPSWAGKKLPVQIASDPLKQ